MKRTGVLSLFLALLLLCSCSGTFETAVYNEDATLGTGLKTLTVLITDAEKTITFTIKTDAETVGEALTEHNLIAGEKGQFGLYIKMANGVRADFEKDGAYWGFYGKNGEYMNSGADTTEFADGDTYELKYTKG
ncbi:MAG: DUF4430 domain-containing protein [Clostridia bacterium]|nr:DUF4430 domain-containing protein [Clostridia bacterium]